jgi:hypothetical protein
VRTARLAIFLVVYWTLIGSLAFGLFKLGSIGVKYVADITRPCSSEIDESIRDYVAPVFGGLLTLDLTADELTLREREERIECVHQWAKSDQLQDRCVRKSYLEWCQFYKDRLVEVRKASEGQPPGKLRLAELKGRYPDLATKKSSVLGPWAYPKTGFPRFPGNCLSESERHRQQEK